jgi:PTS system mannose-specific IIB component
MSCQVEKACEAYKNPKYAPFKTLFLFTKPADVVRAVKGGIPFTSVNLGGMTYKDGDTLISSAVAVNPDDVKALAGAPRYGYRGRDPQTGQ